MSINDRLRQNNITLPEPPKPVANYIPASKVGNLLFVSGQLCLDHGTLHERHIGKVGGKVSVEQGSEAAKLCAINLLAQAKAALGDLDKIKSCVRLGGFINAAEGFTALPPVMNGASDLMVAILGEAGKHTRTTVGVAELPMGAAVEIDAVFEIA
jgi:enamine deaminase RidA (YjgF/YER057c/UK114 family)